MSESESVSYLDLRKARSDVGANARLESPSDDLIRQSQSLDATGNKERQKLDKFGFILNMDSNGNVYDDIIEEDHIPTFAEVKTSERRVKKWNDMISSWDATKKRRRLLHKRLRKGVPDSMRGTVWPLLGNVPKQIQKNNVGVYDELVKKTTVTNLSSSATPLVGTNGRGLPVQGKKNSTRVVHTQSFRQTQDTIERDIHRTYPRHSMFHEDSADSDDDPLGALDDQGVSDLLSELENEQVDPSGKSVAGAKHPAVAQGGQASLRRVLRAYSAYDREVGYCQGMNFIAGMFLTFMSEEEAFWLLVAVMNDPPYRMRGLFGDGMRDTHQVLYVAEKLTHQFLPKLAKHLDKENIHITMYATQWLLTLYTSSFPFDLVVRVWDCFLAEGWKIVYRVMLALMQLSASDLQSLTFEDILGYFRDLPEHVNSSSVMDTALKIPLKTKHIRKYAKEWLSRQQQ